MVIDPPELGAALQSKLAAGAYEDLLGCYAEIMESKGLTIDSPNTSLRRYDREAHSKCRNQFARYSRLVGRPTAEADWKGLWDEYWSRL